MALTGCSTTNYQRIVDGLSPTLSSANTLAIYCKYKPAASEAGTARGIFSLMGDGSGNDELDLSIRTDNHLRIVQYTNGSLKLGDNVNSVMTAYNDTWIDIMFIQEGPHDGSSRAWEIRINDSIFDSGSFTSSNFTATFDWVYVGRDLDIGGGAGADKWAYLAVGSFASVAAARTACTACLTTAPKNVSGFTDSWDLIADGNSDMGGVNLSAAGTGGTFDSDDPLAGGGGAVIISSCFMRSETPWRHVRQLGLRRTTP